MQFHQDFKSKLDDLLLEKQKCYVKLRCEESGRLLLIFDGFCVAVTKDFYSTHIAIIDASIKISKSEMDKALWLRRGELFVHSTNGSIYRDYLAKHEDGRTMKVVL